MLSCCHLPLLGWRMPPGRAVRLWPAADLLCLLVEKIVLVLPGIVMHGLHRVVLMLQAEGERLKQGVGPASLAS